MTSNQTKRIRLGAALLASALAAGAAGAQSQPVQSFTVGRPGSTPYRENPADALARHLRGLAESPRSVGLLIGAGNAALEMGDPQAALTFFARAEEVAPRDGRIKAGMGSAFIQTEQPQAALKFFADAVALGVPVHMIAKDRGLAYDMMGDQAWAQADYALVLQRGSDPETERRMALSKAIAGDRDGALALLEPQVRRHDQAAWRARAFVLALSGDTAGAVAAVDAVLPTQQAEAMRPFLAQLPQLDASQRAMAVHFGRFPSPAQIASNQTAAPQYTAAAPPPPRQTRGRQPATAARSQAPAQRRQPQPAARQPRTSTAQASRRTEAQPDLSDVSKPPPQVDIRAPLRARMEDAAARERAYRAALEEAERKAAVSRQQAPAPVARTPDPQPVRTAPPAQIERQALTQPIQTAALGPSAAASDSPPSRELAPPAPAGGGFADIAAAIAALPDAVEAAPKAKPAAKPAKPAVPAQPSRIWVQIAAAQDVSAFPAEFRRIKAKAPGPLSDKTAWTAPFRSTNRLLVGPFRTEKEARDLVNELAKMNVDSFSWTSAAGQEIVKLPAR